MSALARLVLVWMVSLQDPNGAGVDPMLAASYVETAIEIADAADADPLYADAHRTAAVLTVIAYRESRFRRNAVGDNGASLGLFQTARMWGEPTAETALRVLHDSFRICARRPIEERLGYYAAGGVGCDRRLELSRSRMREVARLVRQVGLASPVWP